MKLDQVVVVEPDYTPWDVFWYVIALSGALLLSAVAVIVTIWLLQKVGIVGKGRAEIGRFRDNDDW